VRGFIGEGIVAIRAKSPLRAVEFLEAVKFVRVLAAPGLLAPPLLGEGPDETVELVAISAAIAAGSCSACCEYDMVPTSASCEGLMQVLRKLNFGVEGFLRSQKTGIKWAIGAYGKKRWQLRNVV